MVADLTRAERARLRVLVEERIDRSAGPDACHPWTGNVNVSGYGTLTFRGRTYLAHRLAVVLAGRRLSPQRACAHLCHDRDVTCPGRVCAHRRCCNERHLQSQTQAQNIRGGRGPELTRARHEARRECANGHALTERNTRRWKRRRICRRCETAASTRYRARQKTA